MKKVVLVLGILSVAACNFKPSVKSKLVGGWYYCTNEDYNEIHFLTIDSSYCFIATEVAMKSHYEFNRDSVYFRFDHNPGKTISYHVSFKNDSIIEMERVNEDNKKVQFLLVKIEDEHTANYAKLYDEFLSY